jgi:hypothetical protein
VDKNLSAVALLLNARSIVAILSGTTFRKSFSHAQKKKKMISM